MEKKKTIQSVSSYVDQIQEIVAQLDSKLGEFTEWADNGLHGKNYKEVLSNLLDNEEYDIEDQGLCDNGQYKKDIQHSNDPVFKVIIYHDKNDILISVFVERN